jgi:hypothetical protein
MLGRVNNLEWLERIFCLSSSLEIKEIIRSKHPPAFREKMFQQSRFITLNLGFFNILKVWGYEPWFLERFCSKCRRILWADSRRNYIIFWKVCGGFLYTLQMTETTKNLRYLGMLLGSENFTDCHINSLMKKYKVRVAIKWRASTQTGH